MLSIRRYGIENTVQLQRSGLVNSVISPAFLPGTGNKRTVSGLFRRKASVPAAAESRPGPRGVSTFQLGRGVSAGAECEQVL